MNKVCSGSQIKSYLLKFEQLPALQQRTHNNNNSCLRLVQRIFLDMKYLCLFSRLQTLQWLRTYLNTPFIIRTDYSKSPKSEYSRMGVNIFLGLMVFIAGSKLVICSISSVEATWSAGQLSCSCSQFSILSASSVILGGSYDMVGFEYWIANI